MTSRPVLPTARLELHPLAVGVADEMVDVLADPALYLYTGGTPPTVEELTERYSRQVVGHSEDGTEEWHNWIVRRRDDGAAVGYVQATIATASNVADVAWVIGSAFQGQGYATEAAAAMVGWLRGVHGVALLVAYIHPDHEPSAAVAERIGLSPTDELDADGERRWQTVLE